MNMRSLLWLILLGMAPGLFAGDLALHELFQDHACIQHGRPAAVWGTAAPGEPVNVVLGPHHGETRADAAGRWKVELPPSPPGGPHTLRVSAGAETLERRDIVFGDVWIATGQSNMQFTLLRVDDPIVEADPLLRVYVSRAESSLAPAEDLPGVWALQEPGSTAGHGSALAQYVGRMLRDRYPELPIGIICVAKGGTHIQSWVPLEAGAEVRRAAGAKPDGAVEAYAALTPEQLEASLAWRTTMAGFQLREWNGESFGRKDLPEHPELPSVGPYKQKWPAMNYHGYLAPLAGLRARGVLWYQGEHNTGLFGSPSPALYREYLLALHGALRELLRDPELPLLVVQLPTHKPEREANAYWGKWAEVREAQLAASRGRPGLATVVTLDGGDELHPGKLHKQEVARRLFLAAMETVYGAPAGPWRGPRLAAAERNGGEVRLRFEGQHGGLHPVHPDAPLSGFLWLDGDGRRAEVREANARIAGDTVILEWPENFTPAFIAYAFHDTPVLTLRDEAGLPAAPFRIPVP